MVRVRVTRRARGCGKHLAIDDPLPAGFEPVNAKLATSGGPPRRKPTRAHRGGEPRDSMIGGGPRPRDARRSRAGVHRQPLSGAGDLRVPGAGHRPRRRTSSPASRPRRCTARDCARELTPRTVRGEGRMKRAGAAPAWLRWRLLAASLLARRRGGWRCTPGLSRAQRFAPRRGVAHRARRRGNGAAPGRDGGGRPRELGPARRASRRTWSMRRSPRRIDASGRTPASTGRRRARHLARPVRGRAAFGGSTITMQLARMSTATRARCAGKLRQAVLAGRIERALSKTRDPRAVPEPRLLRQRRVGRRAGGAVYFGKPAAALSLGEAAFLAVLPRGPSDLRSVPPPGRGDAAPGHILALMQEAGRSWPRARDLAERMPLVLAREPPGAARPALRRHVLVKLCATSETARRSQTTLDGPLQERLELARARPPRQRSAGAASRRRAWS